MRRLRGARDQESRTLPQVHCGFHGRTLPLSDFYVVDELDGGVWVGRHDEERGRRGPHHYRHHHLVAAAEVNGRLVLIGEWVHDGVGVVHAGMGYLTDRMPTRRMTSAMWQQLVELAARERAAASRPAAPADAEVSTVQPAAGGRIDAWL